MCIPDEKRTPQIDIIYVKQFFSSYYAPINVKPLGWGEAGHRRGI